MNRLVEAKVAGVNLAIKSEPGAFLPERQRYSQEVLAD